MGIELRVAILGPLGTYTHEARSTSTPSMSAVDFIFLHRQLTKCLDLLRYTKNSLQYQVSVLYVSISMVH